MSTLWVVEIVFAAAVFALAGIIAALRTRKELARIEAESTERLNSLNRTRERFNELKARFEQLQSEHGELSAEVDTLKKQNGYVRGVLSSMGGETGLPSAQAARALLETLAKGIEQGDDPAKTARKLIALSMEVGQAPAPAKADANGGKTVVSALTR